MKISVIIPVYNQRKIISKTINALIKQDISKSDYEIIVVDDGSTDGVKEYLYKFKKNKSPKFTVFETLQNHGRAAARNLGIKNAKHEVVLLIDGDIIATRELLSSHLNWHKKFPEENFAMLGRITWFPELNITSFMHWLEHGGQLLAYDDLKHGKKVNYTHFYTGNISFKKSFLVKNGLFDESFGRNIFEDLELAYRLTKKNLKLIYNKNALGYHYHLTNLCQYEKRMQAVGRGARIIFKKHPELKNQIALSAHTPRTVANQFFSPIYFVIGKIFNSSKWMGFYYNARFFRSYLRGYKDKR